MVVFMSEPLHRHNDDEVLAVMQQNGCKEGLPMCPLAQESLDCGVKRHAQGSCRELCRVGGFAALAE